MTSQQIAQDSARMQSLEIIRWREIILRLCSATLIGAVLGLNRELGGKLADRRTNSLVALGAALLPIAGIGMATGNDRLPAATAVCRATLGILCGAGNWPVAIVGVALTLVILLLGRPLEIFLHRRFPSLAENPREPPR